MGMDLAKLIGNKISKAKPKSDGSHTMPDGTNMPDEDMTEEEEGKEDKGDEDLEAIAEKLIAAVKGGDVAGVADALKAAIDLSK